MSPKFFFIFLLFLLIPSAQIFAQESMKSAPAPKPAPTPQGISEQGISIEFSLTPLRQPKASGIIAGEEGKVKFRITGTNGAVPLSNLRPVAWIDQRPGKEASD